MNNFENVENIKKKFNWGAFLLTWLWGIGNKTYIPLITIPIALIPKVGLIINIFIAIWLGFNGNKLALKNKEFESLENFIKYQKKWSIAGIIYSSITLLIFIYTMINILNGNYAKFYYKKSLIKNSTDISKTIITDTIDKLNKKITYCKIQKIKCPLDQNEMAGVFAPDFNFKPIDNVIDSKDGLKITFESDGICKQTRACKIKINFLFELGAIGYTLAESNLYINTDESGYLYIKEIEPKDFQFKEIFVNPEVISIKE